MAGAVCDYYTGQKEVGIILPREIRGQTEQRQKGKPLKVEKQKWIPNETSGPGRDKPAPGHRPSR